MDKIAGKRKEGDRKKSWLRNIRERTQIVSVEELLSRATDKEDYNKLIVDCH